mgnify:CR=1 FL=1
MRRDSGSCPTCSLPGWTSCSSASTRGLYSGAVGHHFARPGNRFWKALHASGFTDHEWSPFDDQDLPTVGLGITNLVDRTTASAAELTAEELRTGRGGARGEDSPVPTGYRRDHWASRRTGPALTLRRPSSVHRTTRSRNRRSGSSEPERVERAPSTRRPDLGGSPTSARRAACARVRVRGRRPGERAPCDPLFASLDGGAMADLAGCMTSFEAPAGQVLVEIGQPGSGLFVYQDGEVRWSSTGAW